MVIAETTPAKDTGALLEAAAQVSTLLRTLGNERRLLILCLLIEHGPLSVNVLADHLGLSQSALSQHLAKMREEQLVSSQRESQHIFYQIADPKVGRLVTALKDIFCA